MLRVLPVGNSTSANQFQLWCAKVMCPGHVPGKRSESVTERSTTRAELRSFGSTTLLHTSTNIFADYPVPREALAKQPQWLPEQATVRGSRHPRAGSRR